MYAVIRTWKVPGNRDERVSGLTTNVIPFIKTLPGFVSARFGSDDVTGLSHSYLVFADRDSAERFVSISAPSKERLEAQAEAGVSGADEFVVLDVLAEVTATEPVVNA